MNRTHPDKTAGHAPLTEKVTEALLQAITPLAPDAARAERMRWRTLQTIQDESRQNRRDYLTIHAEEGTWVDLLLGVEMKMLCKHGPSTSFLLRLAPGARLPAHEHLAGEECLVIEGELWLDEFLVIRAGDYHFAPTGLPHGVAKTETGALLFLRSERPAYG